MYAISLKDIAVICLTLSSLVQMSPSLRIVDEMKEELINCPFPPSEDFKQILAALCAIEKPSLTEDNKLFTTELNFSFGKYLCMELFDLSLQLCSKTFPEENSTTLEESIEKFSLRQNVTTFCERLRFSNNRANKTRLWADIAVDILKNRTLCESHCIGQKYINPLCGGIFWASERLISRIQKQQLGEKLDQVVTQPNEQYGTTPPKAGEMIAATKKNELIGGAPNSSVSEKPATSKMEKAATSKTESIQSNEGNPPITAEQKPEKTIPIDNPIPVTTVLPTVISSEVESPNKELENKLKQRVSSLDGDYGSTQNRIEDEDGPNGEENDLSLNEDSEHSSLKASGGAGSLLEGDEEVQSQPRVYPDAFVDSQESHFFAYFLTMVVICIVGYLVFHNKQKIIALALEGRRMQGSRRRPNTSSYKKLDSNLEEAVTSTCSSSSVTHVLF